MEEPKNLDESPKTPIRLDKIPRDESFKTCKSTMPTPHSRLNLRVTPARASMMRGEKPFKEAAQSSGRKQRRGRRVIEATPGLSTAKLQNQTTDSNETFIRCEQELMFDRDSLESGNPNRMSSTPKQRASPKKLQNMLQQVEEENQPKDKFIRPISRPRSNTQVSKLTERSTRETARKRLVRAPLERTLPALSRTLSRTMRSDSYRSTAELERDYFSSLRSF